MYQSRICFEFYLEKIVTSDYDLFGLFVTIRELPSRSTRHRTFESIYSSNLKIGDGTSLK